MSETKAASKARAVFVEIFKFMASLNLAMTLMAVIVVAAITGTICESKLNSDVAREYIYDAPWFNVWLGLLCVNLFSVAAIRYPWKAHQTGFVITHAGIITLLIGAMIDRNWGVEGYLHLNRGEAPTTTMELQDQELRVSVAGMDEYCSTQFKVKTLTTPAKRQFAARAPVSDVIVEVLDVKSVEQTPAIEAAEQGKPAVKLLLRGAAFGQFEAAMFLGDKQDLGMAVLSFSKGLPPAITAAASPTKTELSPDELIPRHVRVTSYSKYEDPTVTALAGEAPELSTKLTVDAEGKSPQLTLKLLGKEFTFAPKEAAGKELALDGLPEWKITIKGFYPNCRVDGPNASTFDEKLDNPAVRFELTGPLIKRGVAVASASNLPHGGKHSAQGDDTAKLGIYLGDDGKLRYYTKSAKAGEKSGELGVDQPIPLGWAPGAEALVTEYMKHAATKAAWSPLQTPFNPEAPNLGLLCRVSAGGESKDVWVGRTPVGDVENASTTIGKRTIELAFCNTSVELPFNVALLNFDAKRHEGMEHTNSIMEYASTLGFDDAVDSVELKKGTKLAKKFKHTHLEGGIMELSAEELTFHQLDARDPLVIPMTDVESYARNSQHISMNRPTNYPVTWYGPWFGTNYKFSQAMGRPDSSDYSGVQVLRDPGWFPEWFGSLMICLGIFTMFYLKPYFRRTVERSSCSVQDGAGAPFYRTNTKQTVSDSSDKPLQISSGE
ncbi:MAG TPA: hypothetical protein VKX17_01115 [Planctomycetota bacterium]|nr:hypothetical protein [Planctomycetota bacterium]